jgi:hypothetical protein
VGIARQRQAIVDGLRESVLAFSNNVPRTTPKKVMDMVLVTQYFDTMKEIDTSSKNSTVFIPHGPGFMNNTNVIRTSNIKTQLHMQIKITHNMLIVFD